MDPIPVICYFGRMPPHRRLQVFISSTYLDLKEERQAAVEAILAAGHIPAGMELFAAGNKSQMATIKKWIDESDVYMLILGHRYGSIEPGGKKSYTHVEYDYAVQKGTPVFSVVASDDWKLARMKAATDPSTVIETQNGPALKKFRELVHERICRPFDDRKDIKVAVHESLREVEHEHKLVGWVRGDAVDREQELVKEIAALKREVSVAEKRAEKAATTAAKNAVSTPDWGLISRHLFRTKLDATAGLSASMKSSAKTEALAILKTYNMLGCLKVWKNTLLLGVSNRDTTNAEQQFLFYKVVPPLLTHGLVEETKVPNGVGWRRYALSQKGKDLLVWMESETHSDDDDDWSPPASDP